MNTNLNSPIQPLALISGEGWAAIAGVIGSALLLAKKLLSPKPAKPELMSRADFYAEMLATRTASTPTTWPSWRSWTPTTGSCWPPWSGRPPASTRSKPASPAWTSARGSNHASLCLTGKVGRCCPTRCAGQEGKGEVRLARRTVGRRTPARWGQLRPPEHHFWRAQFGWHCRPRAPFQQQHNNKRKK